MTLDLHPEDLIDRASMGTIAPDEQRRLDAHLALCDVCRFETKARHAFRMEDSNASIDLDALVASALGSPQLLIPTQAVQAARPAQAANESAMVASGETVDHGAAGALPELPLNRLANLSRITRMARVRPPMQKRAFLLLAAAVVLVSAQAIAGKWNVLRLFVPAATTLPSEGETETSEAPRRAAKSTKVHSSVASGAASETLATDNPEDVAPEAPESPSAATVSAAPAVTTPMASAAPASSASVTVQVPSKNDVEKAPFVPLESATALFEHASRDRVHGDHAAAKVAYAQLFHRFPLSPEATLGRATYGRMLLDDGDAEGALVQLDTYLAEGDSALREQAFAARATALGREGQFDQEVQTWQRLLREYPGSLYSARARERIEEVGAR